MSEAPKHRVIPKGAIRVTDKATGATAYAYSTGMGRPCAVTYAPRSEKPVWHHSFRDEARRAKAVQEFFDAQRKRAEGVARRRAETKAWLNDFQLGDIVRTCWGYEQTNVEFYEVVEVSGKMVTVRQVATESESTGWAMGRSVPQSGLYVGEPLRRRATKEGVRISDCQFASRWGKRVAGVVVGEPANWTSYG